MRVILAATIAGLVLGQGGSGGIAFRMTRLDAGQSETAAMADINHDGQLDVISSESWYEAPTWTKRPIRSIPTTGGYLDNFSDLPVDVDEDGFVDLVQIGYFARRIVWLRNPGQAGGAWAETLIDAIGPTEFAFLVDLDNDGRARELLPQFTGAANAGLSWYGIEKGQWVKHPVSPRSHGHGIGAGDVNGDRRTDILTPQGWFEAPVDPRTGAWTFHETDWLRLDIPVGPPVGPAAPGATAPARAAIEFGFMHVIDLNRDGRSDVLTTMAHSFGVLWLEQRADGTWGQHLIDNTWSRSHASLLVDINGDGQRDFVTGTRFMGRNAREDEPLALYWYAYRVGAAGRGGSPAVEWTRHDISLGGDAGTGLQMAAGDLGHDGDIDLVAGGKSGLFLADNLTQPMR